MESIARPPCEAGGCLLSNPWRPLCCRLCAHSHPCRYFIKSPGKTREEITFATFFPAPKKKREQKNMRKTHRGGLQHECCKGFARPPPSPNPPHLAVQSFSTAATTSEILTQIRTHTPTYTSQLCLKGGDCISN